MFGRIVEFTPKPETKDEIVNVLRREEGYPKLDGILKLYLAAPAICNYYNLETSLCRHFV